MHDLVKYHLNQALRGGIAEAEGEEKLVKRLRAETKPRLTNIHPQRNEDAAH